MPKEPVILGHTVKWSWQGIVGHELCPPNEKVKKTTYLLRTHPSHTSYYVIIHENSSTQGEDGRKGRKLEKRRRARRFDGLTS